MKRWLRRTLRRYGVQLPFKDVVCIEHAKTIRMLEDDRTEVRVKRTLVFLSVPEPGDLYDLIPTGVDDSLRRESPDSQELHRTSSRKGTAVYWMPLSPVVPYTLYVHEYGWSSTAASGDAALYSEFRCDARTGAARVEIITPGVFEAAVVFPWPWWRPIRSVRTLVKQGLLQLESGGERPVILDNGARLSWTVVGPTMGERYICLAFHEHGLALWQNRLEESTLPARMRRLLKAVMSF